MLQGLQGTSTCHSINATNSAKPAHVDDDVEGPPLGGPRRLGVLGHARGAQVQVLQQGCEGRVVLARPQSLG